MVFISAWPKDGTDDDSDFADDHQPDISTNGESIMSGDDQVVAEGCAADSDDKGEASDRRLPMTRLLLLRRRIVQVKKGAVCTHHT